MPSLKDKILNLLEFVKDATISDEVSPYIRKKGVDVLVFCGNLQEDLEDPDTIATFNLGSMKRPKVKSTERAIKIGGQWITLKDYDYNTMAKDRENNKIQAIKQLRYLLGSMNCSLKDAKEAIEDDTNFPNF